MGTNYYLEEDGELVHIGKSSGGWEFSFRGYEDIRSWEDWQSKIAGRDIVDEYDGKMSFADFKQMVESNRGLLNHTVVCKSKYDNIYLDVWQDDEGYSFSGGEFS